MDCMKKRKKRTRVRENDEDKQSSSLVVRVKKRVRQYKETGTIQCDQMARLFVHYFATSNKRKFAQLQLAAQEDTKFYQILNLNLKNSQRLSKFCKSGKIVPNLVTLDWSVILELIVCT